MRWEPAPDKGFMSNCLFCLAVAPIDNSIIEKFASYLQRNPAKQVFMKANHDPSNNPSGKQRIA